MPPQRPSARPIPVRILENEKAPRLEWLDNGPIASPLFEQTSGELRERGLAPRWTDLQALSASGTGSPENRPTALLFHTSRCGSTLLTRMLATLAESSVIAESVILDQLLNGLQTQALDEPARIALLRGFVRAHAQAARPGRCWVKFDCHHIFHLDLIRRAFPGVPWMFLYRNPVEVIVSHARQRGLPMVPAETELLSWPDYGRRQMLELLDEHTARMVARICTAAADGHRPGESLLVNHRDLTARLKSEILPFLRVAADAAELDGMMRCLQEDAKRPGQLFAPDSAAKRAEASPLVRQAATEWAQAAYDRVEAMAARHVSCSSGETPASPATETA